MTALNLTKKIRGLYNILSNMNVQLQHHIEIGTNAIFYRFFELIQNLLQQVYSSQFLLHLRLLNSRVALGLCCTQFQNNLK